MENQSEKAGVITTSTTTENPITVEQNAQVINPNTPEYVPLANYPEYRGNFSPI